jgi:hypothetical protein
MWWWIPITGCGCITITPHKKHVRD